MKHQFTRLNSLLALAAGILFVASSPAATVSFLAPGSSPTPTNALDITNFIGAPVDSQNVTDGTNSYPDGAANDADTYFSIDRYAAGQTFTTPADAAGHYVTAIWVRQCGYTGETNANITWCGVNAGSTIVMRIIDPSQVGTAGFTVHAESYTFTGLEPNKLPDAYTGATNGLGEWMRFGFSTPVALSPSTTYGFDLTTTNPICFFELLGTSNNVYSGGTAYHGGTLGTTDNNMTNLVGDRVFMVEFDSGYSNVVYPPVITNQLANAMVPEGADATFTVGASGTAPFAYQWYFNTTNLLTNQTTATLRVGGEPSTVGAYSVVLTNSAGSATSTVARLAVILPSFTTNVNVSAGGGSILDMNGVSTPFSVRLAGTGSAIATDDPNLQMTADGMNIASADYDFNGQANMNIADAPGINLSSLIGFNGTQDFSVSGTFTNLGAFENYDQIGIFVGPSCTNLVRAGDIWNSDFAAEPGGYGVGTASNDVGVAFSPAPSAPMTVTIARAAGVWSANINGMSVTPNADLSYLNAATNFMGGTNFTAGVFAIETAGLPLTYTMTGLSASLLTGPKLSATASGGNLTLNWNVLSQGLESSTNLSDPNSWTLVPGTGNTNQLIMSLPPAGAKFYRIAP